jgi:predicted kinase
MAAWLDHIRAGTATPKQMARDFPWAEAMIGCPHDTVYHAEGDPWTHTCMVVSELESGDGFADLPPERQEILRLAAWFHDIAKPMTTEIVWDEAQQRERVRQPRHAPMGARIAWGALVDAGYDILRARDVHVLVYWHQRPTHLLSQSTSLLRAIEFGHEAHHACWDDLLRFCRADQDGRVCLVKDGADDNLELIRLYLEEQGENVGVDLATTPWPFETDVARRRYLAGPPDGSPFFTPPAPSGSRVIIMSGLPGSGKDTLIAHHFPGLPVVSLDDLRDRMGISPTGNQGQVIQAGLEAARVHLRQGQDFIWNTTGLSQLTRRKIISLGRDYDARVDAISIDIPLETARARNRARPEPVPDAVIDKLARKREPVMPAEVHGLWSVGEGLEMRRIFGGDRAPAPKASQLKEHENEGLEL